MVDERIVYRVRARIDSDYMKRFKLTLSRQERIYERALEELKNGRKINCWMWYIFPGLCAMAKSRKAFVFSLRGTPDVKAYLTHPILGKRLTECCEALLAHKDRTAEEILGSVDARKLHSSMTMFAYASDDKNSVFNRVLTRYFNGAPEYITLNLLKKEIIVWDFTENGTHGR